MVRDFFPKLRNEREEFFWRTLSTCVLVIIVILLLLGPDFMFILLGVAIVVRSAYELFCVPAARTAKMVVLCSAFFFLVCSGTACLVALRLYEGSLALAWMILVVSAGDIAAYGVGHVIGGAKIFPKTSPQKTWSGCIGGLIMATLAGGFMPPLREGLSMPVLAVVVALFSVLGDYIESFLKRRLGIKDFSTCIPGHGGILDRLDSLFIAAIFLWCFLAYM
ncbi:MAG: phosphatidate cytidylyltransferase [Holosporales bacterium]|jgi:phosphatidate cytidylyltransferase|nr:phosphatidate cytidylyltransferase [Holosporales bacterium]